MRWQQKLAEAAGTVSVKIIGETKRSSPWRSACPALVPVARCDEPPSGGRTRPDRPAGLDVYPQCLVFVSFNQRCSHPQIATGTSRHVIRRPT